MSEVNSYSKTQIWLHWSIAVLVVVQFLLHEPISHAWPTAAAGESIVFHPLIALHVVGGSVLLMLVLWRLGLRLFRGAPPSLEKEPAHLRFASKVAHTAFYFVLLAMPFSGLVAWFGGVQAAVAAHSILKVALIVLIVLHVLAVLVHQFVLRTDLFVRMKRPAL
jgi:cytochrome b561